LKLADEPGLPAPTVRTNTSASVKTNDTKNLIITKEAAKPIVKSGESLPAAAGQIAQATPGAAVPAVVDKDDEDAEPEVSPVDITLEEVKRILVDYIGLMKKANGVASTRPGQNR